MTPLTGWPEPAAVGYVPTEPARSDHEVVELQLLLSRSQAAALEDAARQRGMTTGQILRRVITDLFVDAPPAAR
ncbi:MAG TPA: hypothetical protein VM597_36265 [Gemmataceae bacterium]|nr:hypothetical protein [Gemmataceae bacterium]